MKTYRVRLTEEPTAFVTLHADYAWAVNGGLSFMLKEERDQSMVAHFVPGSWAYFFELKEDQTTADQVRVFGTPAFVHKDYVDASRDKTRFMREAVTGIQNTPRARGNED